MDNQGLLGSEYDLTTNEFNRSLSRAEIGIFTSCKPCEYPHSFFIVAQPGAGKTGLKSYIINRGQDTGILSSFVEFDPDIIGIYHEHYLEIMKDYPDESFQILQRFIRPALDEYLRLKAVKLRANIIQEGTLASKDGYLSILDFQKNGGLASIGEIGDDGSRKVININGGYNIEIAVLAVDRYESLLSCYEREQLFRDQDLPARIVLPKYHDDSYEKMLDTINEIENRRLANIISVYKRGYIEDNPELLWKSGDRRFPTAREAIVYYRNKEREELMRHPENYRERLNSLLAIAEDAEQRNRIKVLSDEFEQEIERYNTIKIKGEN